MITIILNFLGAVLIALMVLYTSNKLLLKRALKKIIIPDLAQHGYKLDSAKSPGFLKKGQFKKEKVHLRPFMLGYPVYDHYVNLQYSSLNDENTKHQVTARISVAVFIVYKVEYSHSL